MCINVVASAKVIEAKTANINISGSISNGESANNDLSSAIVMKWLAY